MLNQSWRGTPLSPRPPARPRMQYHTVHQYLASRPRPRDSLWPVPVLFGQRRTRRPSHTVGPWRSDSGLADLRPKMTPQSLEPATVLPVFTTAAPRSPIPWPCSGQRHQEASRIVGDVAPRPHPRHIHPLPSGFFVTNSCICVEEGGAHPRAVVGVPYKDRSRGAGCHVKSSVLGDCVRFLGSVSSRPGTYREGVAEEAAHHRRVGATG